ncbi:hypothetical protein TWF225_011633 [Orbilia oligospora]|nr:hypothetical protein TWF225_011633 [Orbilia oligospora]KAF3247220.1 hypothetical protein TWF128_008706 [Orbilia oligospora]KAF3262810.1 hypothetical protein TWF217_004108 [Orbilia oligospora]KAF3284499.1 hypothetical protein TWF132_009782 [Orbilia oligospora]
MATTEASAVQLQLQNLTLDDPSTSTSTIPPSSPPSKPTVITTSTTSPVLVKPDISAPASSEPANGPTPPSSPSQRGSSTQAVMSSRLSGPADHQPSTNTAATLSNSTPSQHPLPPPPPPQLSSSSSSSSSQQAHQQPTPPSTLPEDAAFPQAAVDSTMNDSSPMSPNVNVNPVREPYVVEHEHRPSDETSVSPVSPRSATPSSILDDGVPTLDANEAAFMLEADEMDSSHHDHETRQAVDSTVPTPVHLQQRPSQIPRFPSNSSNQSVHSDLPNLQIPQHSPPVPFQPHQTGSHYSFPYATTLPADPRRAPLRDIQRSQEAPLSPDIPPWQPDSEVTSCPICRTGFSFFYRKHHCRKCGRVVCAPCSPHRIAIPRSYVVYPPHSIEAELAQSYIDAHGHRIYADGEEGVEVRICNECLAGENPSSGRMGLNRRQSIQSPSGGAGRFWQDTGPSAGGNGNNFVSPQGVGFGGSPSAPRRRTVSSANPFIQNPGVIPTVTGGFPGALYHHQGVQQAHSLGSRGHPHGFFPGQHHPPYHSHPIHQPPPLQHPTPSYPHPGHQTFTFTAPQFYPSPQPSTHHHHHHHHHQRSISSSHAYTQYSPVNQPIRGLLDTSQQPTPAFSMPAHRQNLPIASQFMSSSSREQQTHSAPPQPQPRLKETDYCPICMTVLPPPNPVTKDESAREAHIQQCIENAVGSPEVSRRRSTSGTPSNPASLANNTMFSQPARALSTTPSQDQTQTHTPGPERSRRNTASNRAGGSGRMVVYTATEKDTFAMGNDAEADGQKAECVICFEEFEAGDSIARLECFCRYHKKCITDWFNRRMDGQCPVHAMNE